ncbi:hypothetical protein AVEN_3231-1 [Araneus ventricosus]|uniref:Uncharacterized protein n=1 Tax=Araneus ventricosus TaxID=182803 RepID=A0A4Y2GAL9_ARAVE|nr:hypothetical protein AVEN_3231-1 [Araneus ventricosus]
MKDGECSKQFPKAFGEETEENVHSYPVYKKRCLEPVRVGKHYIENRWIVPYNPWLSKKYNDEHMSIIMLISLGIVYLIKLLQNGKRGKEGANK